MNSSHQNIIPFPNPAGDRNKLSAVDRLNLYTARIMELEKEMADLKDNPPLRKNERYAVRALINFAAQDGGVSVENVLDRLRNRFNAFDVNDIRSKDYNDVVMYLFRFEENKETN